MDKEDLARILNDILELPTPRQPRTGKSYKLVTALIQTIKEALANGRSVSIPGFGILKVKTRPARKSFCFPYTYMKMGGSAYQVNVPARKYVQFVPSKPLVRLLQEKEIE